MAYKTTSVVHSEFDLGLHHVEDVFHPVVGLARSDPRNYGEVATGPASRATNIHHEDGAYIASPRAQCLPLHHADSVRHICSCGAARCFRFSLASDESRLQARGWENRSY